MTQKAKGNRSEKGAKIGAKSRSRVPSEYDRAISYIQQQSDLAGQRIWDALQQDKRDHADTLGLGEMP